MNPLPRRRFIQQLTGGTLALSIPMIYPISLDAQSDEIKWHNVEDWGIEGKGWTDTKRYFDRLPSKAEGVVRDPVWQLSRHSAGMSVRFSTNSSSIHVRYTLLQDRLSMPHMPATGVSGLDLYAEDEWGVDRWVAVVKPEDKEVEKNIAKDLAPGMRTYTVYLPLYNGVESLEIGTEPGTEFDPISPRTEKPIAFYGTSILHGACASRPGMAFPSILSRRLNRPIYNLGFSGNGRMEKEVAELFAELDPCIYVIDCVPNMNETTVDERAVPLVKILRKARPDTPILLVEDRVNTNARFFPKRQELHRKNRAALKKAYRQLIESGVEGLFYLEGAPLLGEDGEGATDGSHPNDLGMVRYADAYEPVLRRILKQY